jgi:hypothetical protein
MPFEHSCSCRARLEHTWCPQGEPLAADSLKRSGINLPEPAMPRPSRSRTSRPSLAPSSLSLWGTDQEGLFGADAWRDHWIRVDLVNWQGKSVPSDLKVEEKGMRRGSGGNVPGSGRENTEWKLMRHSPRVGRRQNSRLVRGRGCHSIPSSRLRFV